LLAGSPVQIPSAPHPSLSVSRMIGEWPEKGACTRLSGPLHGGQHDKSRARREFGNAIQPRFPLSLPGIPSEVGMAWAGPDRRGQAPAPGHPREAGGQFVG